MDGEAPEGEDIRRLVVEPEADGERLDRFLAARLSEFSRTRVQEWIRQGRLTVDGQGVRASQPVRPGQEVRISVPALPPAQLTPLEIPLNVLYEDEHLLVVVKPAGLQVHPGAGEPRPTLVHALLHRYPEWRAPGPPERPGIVHRLDRDTSGLLLVARTPLAYRRLGRAIMNREVTRRYVALVWGHPEQDAGLCQEPLGRDPRDRRRMAVVASGRNASTRWRVLRKFDTLTLLDLVLGTGRTHQIRVHLAHLGHPVFGDPVYGGARSWLMRVEVGERRRLAGHLRLVRGQALHAYHLSFRHPADERRLRFEAPVPAEMDQVLKALAGQEMTS